MNWAKNDVITTASQDHTMKLFDVEKNYDFHTINLKDSVATSTDYRNDTILAGQEDGYVKYTIYSLLFRIWDIRDLTNVSSKTYKSHGIWISKV